MSTTAESRAKIPPVKYIQTIISMKKRERESWLLNFDYTCIFLWSVFYLSAARVGL